MAQTATSSWLSLPASSEGRRSEYLDSDAASSASRPAGPFPQPPPTELSRWDLAQLLNPSLDHRSSHRKMSLDYNNRQFDIPPTPFDPHDPLDIPDDPSYGLFAPAAPNSFTHSFAPRHASSSSSLNRNFGLPDPMYPHESSTFATSLPSFHSPNSNPYDIPHGVSSSSYSSGKASPLTPNDPVNSFHSPFLPSATHKSAQGYSPESNFASLVGDGRNSNPNSNAFHSDFPGDYGSHSALGLGFSSSATQDYAGRIGSQFSSDARFASPPSADRAQQQQQQQHSFGVLSMQTGSHPYRNEPTGYEDIPQFMPRADLVTPMFLDDTMQSPMGSATDLQTFIRPYLDQYVHTSNRLAFGERTVIVMSSKVAQKSYGTEKRFLCPPPTAIMIGNSWWSDSSRRGQEPKQAPPRVVISISGEPVPQEGTAEWSSAAGKPFDVSDPPSGTTYVGRCVGKQLFISDVDEKKKKVEALVKIMAPTSDDEPDRIIGTFPSRPIKVISKPSKKRQSAKNLELCINHGSTISLFHRLRSQTVSTKYLCVSGSNSSFKGSDGSPLTGLDQRSRAPTPSFIARTASWDPFIVYIVDVTKPAGGSDSPPPPPPQPDYPSPPPNAIPFTNNGSQIPVYYNQTVVLQCLTSGVVSPILIIRKVDHQTIVVGGGLQEGAKGVADHFCPPDEVCGDPVSQLHKIAFEVYDANKGPSEPGTPGITGAFLSCMGEKVNTYRPIDGRQWNSAPSSRGSVSPGVPGSPMISTPASSTSGQNDYFGSSSSRPESPTSYDMSNDGGRVKKGKRSSSSAGGITKTSTTPKGRRRQNSAGSATSGRQSSGEANVASGALWQVDIGETSVWTIVGTDQIRYNFYVPPVLFNDQNAAPTGSFPVPSKPVTPFPGVVKYLPPDRAAETPKHHASRGNMVKPHPQASKMLTVYGENFSKTDPVTVFFGSDPSPFVEVRCTEVLGCLPPDSHSTRRRPILLVRPDGVIFPSNTMYP